MIRGEGSWDLVSVYSWKERGRTTDRLWSVTGFIKVIVKCSDAAITNVVLIHEKRWAKPVKGIWMVSVHKHNFVFLISADRRRGTDRWTAITDTEQWEHREQIHSKTAPCVQHSLPLSRSGPSTDVWGKFPEPFKAWQLSFTTGGTHGAGVFLWRKGPSPSFAPAPNYSAHCKTFAEVQQLVVFTSVGKYTWKL